MKKPNPTPMRGTKVVATKKTKAPVKGKSAGVKPAKKPGSMSKC